MRRRKVLFGGKSYRYFNHRIGTYGENRSLWLRLGVPVFSFLIVASMSTVGWVFYQKNNVVLGSENNIILPESVETLTQKEVDQQVYQVREDETLAKNIAGKLDEMPEGTKWSVSLRDLKTGRMANVNSDQVMNSASLYKLFLLPSLEKRLNPDYWGSYVGNRSIEQCVVDMIAISDNDCPHNMASWYIGWQNINPSIREVGFKKTTIAKEEDGGMRTTARETAEMMYRLQNSQILSDKARRLVFDGLYEQKLRDGIPAGCGQECLVGNKTGEIEGFKHDAAIVTHGDAQYVLVIMSEGASWTDVANLAKQIDFEMLP